jgi:tetratricopeptide (TPR) repeat protein
MKTKESSFTLPFMLLLIEGAFFRPFTRKQFFALTPFLLTLLIIPFSRMDTAENAEPGWAQQTTEIGRLDYLFTQFRVILTYLRLLVLPIHQNLDYDYPIYHSLFELPVFLSFLFLLSLFGLALYLLRFNSKLGTQNSRLIAFGILWFFLTLSIESSIIPIRDVIFEHRLYLPSAGMFLTFSTAGFGFLRGISHRRTWMTTLVFTLVLCMLSVLTYQRNRVWRDDVTLWTDVAAKASQKSRVRYNLGLAYSRENRPEDALREYEAALRLKPNDPSIRNNLGNVYNHMGRTDDAIHEYQTAIRLNPNHPDAHYNLARALEHQEKLAEAVQEYQAAIRVQPDDVAAHNNLGRVFQRLGNMEEARRQYQEALRIKPDLEAARKALLSLE